MSESERDVKTNKRILDLARNTLEGHRGAAHQEFRTVVAANGYRMSRGGWVQSPDPQEADPVCRGWEAFAYMVSESREITLHEPQAIAELEDVEEAEAEEMATDAMVATASAAVEQMAGRPLRLAPENIHAAVREAGFAPAPASVEITYLYTTRLPTVRLSDSSMVSALVVEDLPAVHEGACQSGAALDCSGTGFLRLLPESMLAGQERVQVVQCLPCYEASAAAYLRKLHRYIQTEAR